MKKISLEKYAHKLGLLCATCIFTCLVVILIGLAIFVTACLLRWLFRF